VLVAGEENHAVGAGAAQGLEEALLRAGEARPGLRACVGVEQDLEAGDDEPQLGGLGEPGLEPSLYY
jgi:hypothetical protein